MLHAATHGVALATRPQLRGSPRFPRHDVCAPTECHGGGAHEARPATRLAMYQPPRLEPNRHPPLARLGAKRAAQKAAPRAVPQTRAQCSKAGERPLKRGAAPPCARVAGVLPPRAKTAGGRRRPRDGGAQHLVHARPNRSLALHPDNPALEPVGEQAARDKGARAVELGLGALEHGTRCCHV